LSKTIYCANLIFNKTHNTIS